VLEIIIKKTFDQTKISYIWFLKTTMVSHFQNFVYANLEYLYAAIPLLSHIVAQLFRPIGH
jgi:hypothetical protein